MIWKLNFDHWLQWLVNGTVFGFVFVFRFVIFASVFEETVLNLGTSDNSGLKLYLILTPSGCCPVSTLELSEMVCDQTLMRSGVSLLEMSRIFPSPSVGPSGSSHLLCGAWVDPLSPQNRLHRVPLAQTSPSMGNLCTVCEFIFTFEIKKKKSFV